MGDLKEILTSNIVIALVMGIIISLIVAPISIPLLRKLKFGQNIREEGPQSHLKKAGTPTMGGVIFLISTTVVMLFMGYGLTDESMIALYSLLAFGFIGFLDDLLKILKKQSEGLKAWQKFLLLLIFSSAIAYYCYVKLGSSILIPFTDIEIPLSFLYIPFVVIYFTGATNAVNLTDGLDGLATSVTILVMTFFAVVAYTTGHHSLTVFSVALIGGLLGFLRYNGYPARVFMGDTGSLALGGAVSSVALILEQPLILAIVGGIYVIETLSVILQVSSYKLRGKRLFKMAPIHHHFEQEGWSEVKVVTVFSIITVILCIIGFLAI